MVTCIPKLARKAALAVAVFSAVLLSQTVSAQLQLQLTTDRERYLVYEPVQLTITLRNYTGNKLVFQPLGGATYELRLFITDSRDIGMRKMDVSQLLGGVVFGAGETKQLTIDVSDVANLSQPREYTVFAEIEHEMLPRRYPSNDVSFQIREGHSLWNRTVGIPRRQDGETNMIVEREIVLRLLHETKSQIYCLQIWDRDNVYRTVRLGKRIMGTEPQIETDAVSNIHVLLRLKSRLFAYKVFDIDGKQKQEKYLAVDTQVPRLFRDMETGRVAVVGGRPAKKGVDFVFQADDTRITPYTEIKESM